MFVANARFGSPRFVAAAIVVALAGGPGCEDVSPGGDDSTLNASSSASPPGPGASGEPTQPASSEPEPSHVSPSQSSDSTDPGSVTTPEAGAPGSTGPDSTAPDSTGPASSPGNSAATGSSSSPGPEQSGQTGDDDSPVPSGAGGTGGDSSDAGTSERGGAGGTDPGGAASTPEPDDTAPVAWPIINGVQWADTAGNPIQAHGGGALQVGDDYYWFGENRNADGSFYAVSAYRSRDLQRWERVNDVLTMDSDPDLDPANIERPKVVYNEATGRYVMWMHWENGMGYGEARAAVASSETVDGDYTYHGSFRPLQDSGVTDHDKPGYMSRDCSLFVDDDGKGYFISASNENYDLHLYSLSDDYLSIESRAALLFKGGHREAPALFKRNGVYFLLTSGATGWDPNQAQYATSTSLTSGWSSMKNVGDGTTFHSQSTYVLPITGSEGTAYLYLGDRWAGAWDGRVNDSTYVWLPITFGSDTEMSMSWANNVKANVERGSIQASTDAFTFVNAGSGMLLSVSGAADQNSADLIQQERGTATSTAWRLNYDGEGYFTITNEDGGKVIDVPDESTQAGTHLHLWDGNGGDHQAYRLIDLGEGRFQLLNKKSGLSVGVADAAAGSAVEQQQASESLDQVWEIEAAQ